MKYTVYYNAVDVMQESTHLMAVGYCSETGWTPMLRCAGPEGFLFSLEESGKTHAQVLTPFAIVTDFPWGSRSVNVSDGSKRSQQVQVWGIEGVGSGENTAANWVESRGEIRTASK